MTRWFLRLSKALLICDGFIAGAPQIARIIQRGSSDDVSILSWAWMFVMACLWAWQGHRDKSAMTFWGSVVWAINNAAVSIIAVIYR